MIAYDYFRPVTLSYSNTICKCKLTSRDVIEFYFCRNCLPEVYLGKFNLISPAKSCFSRVLLKVFLLRSMITSFKKAFQIMQTRTLLKVLSSKKCLQEILISFNQLYAANESTRNRKFTVLPIS